MKTIAVGALSLLVLSGSAAADILYTSTTQTGFRANGGQLGFLTGAAADGNRALFDEIPIPNARLSAGTVIDVTRVTVGIRRVANAPATDVSVFWASFTTGAVAPDTALDTPPFLIGTSSLGINGAAAVTELVVRGDGITPMFTVALNTTLFDGFGSFSIGVGLSNPDGANGWRITSGPDANANVFWLFDPNHTASANTEGAFLFSNAAPPNPPATFYVIVEGNVVPTPGCAGLLALGGLAALRRRR